MGQEEWLVRLPESPVNTVPAVSESCQTSSSSYSSPDTEHVVQS